MLSVRPKMEPIGQWIRLNWWILAQCHATLGESGREICGSNMEVICNG